MSFCGDLGLRRVVNAATTFTAVGGSLMPPEVLAAMTDAASSFVDMHELHAAAGHRLAGLTGNEAAHQDAGCGAAIVLSVLACATGGDPAKIARLPGARVEVVVHAAHRIPYDPAITLDRRDDRAGRQRAPDVRMGARRGDHRPHRRGLLRGWLAPRPPGRWTSPPRWRSRTPRGVPVVVDAAAGCRRHTISGG